MKAFSVPLQGNYDVFNLGASSGFLWSDNGFTLAGLGDIEEVPVENMAAFPEAASVLGATLCEQDEAAVNFPVGFAALPFDRDAAGSFFVPSVLVRALPSGEKWLTVRSTDAEQQAIATGQRILDAAVSALVDEGAPSVVNVSASLDESFWKENLVGVAIEEIEKGLLQKVVLAREIVLQTGEKVPLPSVMSALRSVFPTALLFAVDGFVGASPEMLVARRGTRVFAHPLAGTAARKNTVEQDDAAARALISSTKDQWEHRVTISWLLETLLPFCSFIDAEPEPSIVSLANVMHLGTQVEGQLSVPPASVAALVSALHPTPAVGGAPQEVALDLIRRLESGSRGRYAGPVGWFDSSGDGSFAVGIRSAQLSEDEVRLFAGVGIVEGSDPEAELAETKSKAQAMLGAFGL